MDETEQNSLYETPIIKDFKYLNIKLITVPPNPPVRSTSMSNLFSPSSEDSESHKSPTLKNEIAADLKSSPSFLRQQKYIEQLLAADKSPRQNIYNKTNENISRKSMFFSDDDPGYEIPLFKKNTSSANNNNIVKIIPPKLPPPGQKPFIKQKTFPSTSLKKKDVAQVLPQKSLPEIPLMPRVKPISIKDMAIMKQEVLTNRAKTPTVQHFSTLENDQNCVFGKEIQRLDDIPINIDWNSLTVEDIERFLELSKVNDDKIKTFTSLGIDGVRLKQMSEKMLTMEPFCLNEFFAQQIYSFINGWRPKRSSKSILFTQSDILND